MFYRLNLKPLETGLICHFVSSCVLQEAKVSDIPVYLPLTSSSVGQRLIVLNLCQKCQLVLLLGGDVELQDLIFHTKRYLGVVEDRLKALKELVSLPFSSVMVSLCLYIFCLFKPFWKLRTYMQYISKSIYNLILNQTCLLYTSDAADE